VPGDRGEPARSALAAERALVRTLGGFVLGIAGAELVTHEKIPIPRFNFVEVSEVSPERQTAFFERALDHYFQRALRPTFRVPVPEPDHVRAGLRRFGFVPSDEPLVLLVGGPGLVAPPAEGFAVRPAEVAELDAAVELWAEGPGRPEFRAAVDVTWHHPNPGERLVPFVAERRGRVASAALRYDHAGTAGLHCVTTRPSDRGQGAASALVAGALDPNAFSPETVRFLFADSARLERRLRGLGFVPARAFREYALPLHADLALPSPGPMTPPRWRPPRDVPPGRVA
jgi:GNAT superfamily N-acetyltransferase